MSKCSCRTETIQLKTGEETKMKTYCALCFSSRPLTSDDLRHLSAVKVRSSVLYFNA